MKLYVNENLETVQNCQTVGDVRDCFKADADIIICDGAPVPASYPVNENNRIVLIKRGEIPTAAEMKDLMKSRNPIEFTQALSQATIGVAGVGGLGSAVAIALARSFVGTLILVDFDVIEPSNLNRQQYFIDQIGKNKVDALKENLERINPYLKIITHNIRLDRDNLLEIFNDAPIVAECFDSAEAKAMIAETILTRSKKTVVGASGVAGYSSSEVVCKQKMSRYWVVGDATTAAQPGSGLTAARVGIAANLQAAKIIEILIDNYQQG